MHVMMELEIAVMVEFEAVAILAIDSRIILGTEVVNKDGDEDSIRLVVMMSMDF